MINLKTKILFSILTIVLITGCSTKDQEYNKSESYWYNKMIQQISNYRLDEADETYTSLESEHRRSMLLPSALMIIANAHIDDEEYMMANYYLDEYIKKYSTKKDIDYVEFLKIKSNFLAFKNQFREQNLITKTLKEVEVFLKKYPNSQYLYMVNTIKARLLMAKSIFDQEIADLYGRVDKPKAQEFYNEKAKKSWDKPANIKPVDVPWYRWLFE